MNSLLVTTKEITNMNMLSQIKYHLSQADKIARENDLGDIFSYSRAKEVLIAEALGHTVATTYSGADGYDKDGKPVEYKSTVGKKISATYNGISVQPTWEEQVTYLQNEKIGKYAHHYFARFEGTDIKELWMLTAEQVLKLLLPALEKQFNSTVKRKDPRLGYGIRESKIKKYGKRII